MPSPSPFQPLLQLGAIASKEVKLIGAQRIALALVLVYPALVMLSLALAFGQGTAYAEALGKPAIESVSAALYLPESGEGFDRESFLEKISDQNALKLEFVSTPEAARQAVASGQKTVAILVQRPSAKNQPVSVEVVYDNSSVVAGKAVAAQVSAAVRGVAYQTATELLGDIWSDLGKIEADLDSENQKLLSFSETLARTREKLEKLGQQFDSIDLEKETGDLDAFNSFYGDTKTRLESSRSGLEDTRALLTGYKKKVFDAQNTSGAQTSELLRMRQNLAQMQAYTAEPLRSQLQQMQNSLAVQVNSMNKVSTDLRSVLVDIDSTAARVEGALSGVDATEVGLEDARKSLGGFEDSVSSLEQTVAEGKPTVFEAKESQAELNEDVKKTRALMDGMLENVHGFKAYQPAYLVTPVEVTEKEAFQASQLAVVTPVGVAIVLLLTCILLTALSVVLERNAGISKRVALSSVSRGTWLAGKLFGQLAFALVEAGIVLGLAVFAFNVPLHAQPLELLAVLVVIALAFSALGLFIAQFTQTLSTAILGSLLAMIPMLFLSGTIFPFEFMPAGIATISRFLPLTAAKEVLLALMVKGLSLAALTPLLGLLGGYALLLTALAWVRKER